MTFNLLRTQVFADTASHSECSEKQTCYGLWRAHWNDSIHRSMEGDLENHLRERDANNVVSMDKDRRSYHSKIAQGKGTEQVIFHKSIGLPEQELPLMTRDLRKWEAP